MRVQEGLFINGPVYDHQSLDALVVHAYYTAKHLTTSRMLGYKSAMYVQVCCRSLMLCALSICDLKERNSCTPAPGIE